jgi:hypothetical protein
MSDIKAFLKQNKEVKENVKVVVSDGFKDEKGKPVPFEIKALTAMEDEAIRNACMRKVQVTGKKNQFTNELDSNRYVRLLCTNSVVFPNLKDAELQDSYGVSSPDDLLVAMLTAGEFNALAEKVSELSMNKSVITDEDIEEAKN